MSSVSASTHIRKPSRSNSTSSSVVTVRKSNALPSTSVHRTSRTKIRNSSPDRLTQSGRDFLSPDNRPRPSSSSDGKGTPNLNINRWSHSTSSSISALDMDTVRHQSNFPARRLSIGTRPTKATISENRGDSQIRSPAKHSTNNLRSDSGLSPNPNVPNMSKQGLAKESLKTVTPQITPTSMFNTVNSDYFGEKWQQRNSNNKLGESLTALQAQERSSNTQSRHKNETDVEVLDSPGEQNEYDPRVSNGNNSLASQNRRSHRSPTQKTMLSKALAKANNAVLFDNSQNIDGAIEAYAEACDLLQQVMVRSSDLDDRKKLSAIRSTYSNRIAELHDLDDSFSSLMEKALPEDPPMDDSNQLFFSSDGILIEPTTAEVLERVHIPPRQESLLPQIFGGDKYLEDSSVPPRNQIQTSNVKLPMNTKFMPPPLSPRRPLSPASTTETDTPIASKTQMQKTGVNSESISWLDTIDDADSSSHSSQLSSIDQIEADFDAALNAAVDAAYDNEMVQESTPRPEKQLNAIPSSKYQGTYLGNRVNGAQGLLYQDDDYEDEYEDEDDDEAAEDRLIDEMTQGFVFDDFHFDKHSKSALPRQSDSSTFSGHTWGSSVPSTTLTSGTTLSTLAESLEASDRQFQHPTNNKSAQLPTASTTDFGHMMNQSSINYSNNTDRSVDNNVGSALRDRRLSGQTAGQLKIETFAKRDSSTKTESKVKVLGLPKIEVPSSLGIAPFTAPPHPIQGPPSTSTVGTLPATPLTSVHSSESITSESPATPALTQGGSQGSVDESHPTGTSPSKQTKKAITSQPAIRKNLSSTSLGARNVLTMNNEVGESPLTPASAGFGPDTRKAIPPLPTTMGTSLGLPSGGLHLFDDPVSTPISRAPGPVNTHLGGIPPPLEPCPESFLLRPFWLMRCLYQTLAHPRGGYVSTKLFIPRDIWRVRSVKLKLIDEKVSQCDFLTAALSKLSKVDQLDAEAVLEELQSFELILEQVRLALQKKLGGEVGFSSSSNIFKPPNTEESLELPNSKMGNSGSSTKSFASSWRKLRSKSSTSILTMHSAGNVNPGANNYNINANGTKDSSITHTPAGLTMSSLPMTSSTFTPNSRNQNNKIYLEPPTPTELPNIPVLHANYMSSLAQLFDAVQILDSIGRQVVDPGLKCSSKTHVGLEFSVRNAAEFFAFYIIRFVMADIALLIDKYLKRGTEWVVA